MPRRVEIAPEIIKTKSGLPKGTLKQYGSTLPKFAPKKETYLAYERVATEDVIGSTCIDILIQAVLSSIGSVIHDDDEIADFCNYVLARYEDLNSTHWKSMLDCPLRTLMWAGNSVSESIFSINEYKHMVLDDLVTYHPSTITIHTDESGRLVEGKASYYSPLVKSGIYQIIANSGNSYAYRNTRLYGAYNQVLLPRKKIIFLNQKAEFGDYYGKSSIAPIYRWVLLKEAFIDMMANALDKYGNPIFYIAMPDVNTGQTTQSDSDENLTRAVTTFDTLKAQLENLGRQGNGLLLPFTSKDTKPDVGQIVSAPNIGSVFMDAIQYCNEQIAIEMGVPFFLISGEIHGREKQETEHRMAIFYHRVEEMRSKVLNAICKQLFQKIIQYNFDGRASARIAPRFSKVYGDRAEDRVATMQVITGLVKAAVLNPQEQTDFNVMREMVGLPGRALSASDTEVFNLLYKKVPGIQNGRPRGATTPQQKARPKTVNKPQGKVTEKSKS